VTFPYLAQQEFLTPAQAKLLREFCFGRRRQFVPSTVSTGDATYRRSEVLFDLGDWAELIREKVAALIPAVLPALGIPPFEVGMIEAQITVTGDGGYFRRHNDNGSPDTASRVLSYVYYFHRLPRGFNGGELQVFDGFGVARQEIDPTSNTIVFFPSAALHAVHLVQVPSGEFEDGRFTLNGWVRRKE